MWEVKETAPASELHYGHATVGVTAVPLTVVSRKLVHGLLLRTPGPNDLYPNIDTVYIGKQGVTTSASDGIPMPPGSVLELPVEDPSQIYAISLTAGQDITWVGV